MQTILEQDWIVQSKTFQLRRQQSKCGDRGQWHLVLDRDELRLAVDFEICGRVDFVNVQFFVNCLGPHIVFRANARSDFIPGGARNDHANGLFATAFELLVQFDLRCWPSFEAERIERPTPTCRSRGEEALVKNGRRRVCGD